jgi:hypothetical protein
MSRFLLDFQKRIAVLAVICLFFIEVNGQVSITSATSYTETFSGFAGSSTPADWFVQGTGSRGTTWNGTNQSTGTSGGWYGNDNMSFLGSSSAANGNGTWQLQNNIGSPIIAFTLSFTARQWRSGTASPQVNVYWQSNSSSSNPAQGNSGFTQLSSLTFSDATSNITSGVTLTQVVTGLNIANGDYIYIRFIHDGGSNSDNLGWDDVSITPSTTCVTASQPSSDASSLSFGSASCGQMTLNWTNGNGANRIVVAKAGSAVAGTPSDLTMYASNAAFGSGSTIATGEYVVYNGTGNSVTVTNLTGGTTYYFSVFEYNGTSACDANYYTSGSPATNSLLMPLGSSSTDYYRSIASGTWSSTSTWETSPDNVTWYSACAPPTNTSASVTIRSPHTVTISSSVTVDQVTINSGATLQTNGSVVLTISNTSGVQLQIDGTFIDGSSANVSFGSNARWAFGSNGTLVKTSGSSSNIWQNAYNGGASTMPSTANWILRKISASNPVLTTIGAYYPNLTIENNYTSSWVTSVGSTFTGNSGYATVKGNFDIGGSGSNTVDFLNDNTHSQPAIVIGNMTIRSGNTLRNNGTGFELQGNLTCNGTISYDASDTRTLNFTGSIAQSINGSGTLGIYNMTINKSSNDLTLNRAITVDNLLTFTSGRIFSTATNLLTINTNGSVASASNTSFTSGPVRYVGLSAFTFPVGKQSSYQPLSISAAINTTSDFTSEYFIANPQTTFNNILGPGLYEINNCEYWTLVRNAGTETKEVTLSWTAVNACPNAYPPADLRVARWDTTMWLDEGNIAYTGSIANGTVTSTTQTAYGAYTLAYIDPLPITLLNFTAEKNGNDVVLKWTTASETNNDYFEILSSVNNDASSDGFVSIGKVQGQGNSTQLNSYSFTDHRSAKKGTYYYRLRQVDFDGQYSFSKIAALQFGNNGKFNLAGIFPNPFSENTTVQIYSDIATELSAQIFDAQGREIASMKFPVKKGMFSFNPEEKAPLANGVYLIRLTLGDEIISTRIVKQ